MTCDYGSIPSCKLSQRETAGKLLGSIPNLSTRPLMLAKHCGDYLLCGVIGSNVPLMRWGGADSSSARAMLRSRSTLDRSTAVNALSKTK